MPVKPAEILSSLQGRGATLAVAESLTGGLLTDAFVRVPGASAVLRGGIVAYATDLKAELLGVDAALLARRGAVDPDVAEHMASGVRARLNATYGVSTTGVAGPDPQDGQPVGTVYIAVSSPARTSHTRVHLEGDRQRIRTSAVVEAIEFLARVACGTHGT